MLQLTLLSEGASDAVLVPPLRWMLLREPVLGDFTIDRVDFGLLPNPPKHLSDRVARVRELVDPDLILVHRDADNTAPGTRQNEIAIATRSSEDCVAVVPVRMSEAWFLFDERALREAAGAESGRHLVRTTTLADVESLVDPKTRLQETLKQASGLSGRRLKRFDWRQAYHRLAEIIEDYEPLMALPAFATTEAELRKAVRGAVDA